MVGKWVTLPKTNSSPLKMDGWKTNFLLGVCLFSWALAVSFREGIAGIAYLQIGYIEVT